MATTAQLAREYTYRDEDAVRTFLVEHPRIVPILAEARRLIPHYFGMNLNVVLDVMTDPEESEARSLFALIQTSLEPDEALPLLDAFNDRWWRTTSATFAADVHFGLDYV